mmetsp:Transcript_10146/g.17438  ORF Transcript_10146/g.17438 Transcript_10146/m.17438 type:complete len:799 (-) Transcript_10146:291-2687(-)|eukprot:CAMPEP_0198210990 /NCGR_PEP_ID=MMETSP1445-20131203/22554_1 /TAXON_ID=36898 /ORGANISM="Pyramimonas sp., Strain CCMP2087" /LENGTH=798 /DNA_ID=CAMNT_0043885165 /DNA_START=208 /DNA_END=2604 /DNA_ORIENTATION=+
MDLDKASIKKKVRPGAIELDPSDCAIIVHYEIEEAILGESGEPIAIDKKKEQKKIKVKTLSQSSNIQALAQEIVDKCKLISSNKVAKVESLLKRLQQRELEMGVQENYSDQDSMLLRQRLEAERYQQEQRKYSAEAKGEVEEHYYGMPAGEVADVDNLDEYLEKLYDDMEEKVKATFMIAQLARSTENLEVLLMSENLLNGLSRVLREDGRKSIDLAINIISVFFSFSHFSQFHQVLLEHQIGDMTMRLVDLELKRADEREKLEKKEPPTEAKQRKAMMVTRKQDKLLYVCLYLLLNLAEDVNIERKIKKRNVVAYLAKVLERRNVELLILSVTFLKKLSIYKENKDKMQECGLVGRLAQFVPVSNDVLQNAVLRLLLNLSFDIEMREEMVKSGLVQKVVELMRNPLFQNVSMALLYHISMDDKCKSMFTYTGVIPWLFENILVVDDLHAAPELISLAVNLTQNCRNAEVLCEGDGFSRLVHRGLQTEDPLLWKVIRNISQQDTQMKLKFKPFLQHLIHIIKDPETTNELLVEVLGSLGNLNIPQFDPFYLVKEHSLMDFLAAHLVPGEVEDDIVLEVVIFIGTLCSESTAALIVQAGLVEKLFQLMSDKKEDDEMVLQISFCFHKLLTFQPTREALLRYTQVVFYLVDLLQDKNREVRKTANLALDVIIDSDEEWAIKVRRMKFESFNQEWLAVIEQDTAEYQQQRMYMQSQGEAMEYGSDDNEEGRDSRYRYGPATYGAEELNEHGEHNGEHGEQGQFWSEEEELYARQQMMNDGYYDGEQGSPHDHTGYSDEHYI